MLTFLVSIYPYPILEQSFQIPVFVQSERNEGKLSKDLTVRTQLETFYINAYG